MTNVPLLDLKAQFAQIRDEVMPLIEQVCAGQHFILGEHVRGVEEELARYCGAAYGIGVSSGTDALLLALMTLEIGAGDAVVTSPFTFFATAGAITRAGARPLFCDIDPTTFNLSPSTVQTFIGEQCSRDAGGLVHRATGARVKALLPVHLYGQAAEMSPLMAIASHHGLRVIEDAAQAIGSEYEGARVGSIGDIGCFSFFPSKNLGAFGDAGLCTTQDAALAERMRVLRVHGGKPKYYHSIIGGNFRLDELQAAVLRVKLRYLDGWTQARQRNAGFYTAALAKAALPAGSIVTPQAVAGRRHIFNQYVVRVSERDGLKNFLAERRIGTEIYYPVPLHLQPCFEYLGYVAGDFPESERAAAQTLALPIYPELTQEQLAHVVASVGEFVKTS